LYVAVSLSKCYHQPAGLPSFPTRRSSDLLVCSGLALSVVLALVVATREPYLLVYLDAPIAGMTLADAAAEESTLRGLGWLLAPVLPVLVAARLWQARVIRPPVAGRVSWF